MWEIKGKDNQTKVVPSTKPEYNGEWMGESYVTVTVESPTPVNFEIGDYIIYRDERFEINYDPSKIKSAPRYEKGDAFKYENIKFNSLADELTRCDFLDVVLEDNQLHFTGLPKFSFYGGVRDLANRMQANLDRTYGKGTWQVIVSPEYSDTKEVNISVDTIKVQGALSILVNDLETYYTIKGRTITIGAAGVPADHLFTYGKGNGLYEIEQNAETDQAIVTRLRAYGSTRNLPHRYYNSLSGADGQKLIPDNMAVQYLMLPSFPYTTQDPYIDSANKAKLGIREGTVFFDGTQEGLDEIYPSIEGMTAEQLKDAGVPCNSMGALDEIVSAEQIEDNGVGEVDGNETKPADGKDTFKVVLKDLGFDIWEHRIAGTAPVMSFKTGMLGGRDFEIVGCKKVETGGKVTGYELELNRVYDDDIQLWFPYSSYNAKAEDKFVILQIEMPEVYIKAAARRLLKAATAWLAKNDYSRSVYAPKIDEIFMARQHDVAMASGGKIKSLHDTLKEGMLLLFEDEDLNIDASIFIDRLTIKEEGAVPTYEVVLKEEKTVGRLDKMQNQIDSLAAGQGQGGGGYTAAQIRSLISAYGGSMFLSKLKDDRSVGKISSDKGFEVGKFVSGVAGGFFGMDANGDSMAEVARLYVRVKAFFEELTVIKSNVLAGKQYITPGGGITCLGVEELDDVYRCYFLSEQDGEKTETKIIAGDQAISEMFNAKAGTANKVSNHRYWRLVTAVSNDAYTDDNGNHYGYIDLSKTDCESGSDIPQTGDEICQLGYRGSDKPERQTAMIFSTVDSDAPSIKMFSGIGSGTTNAEHYSLAGKVIISFGRDTITGKIFFRLGATGATQYLEYTQDGGLEIAGAISTKSTIDNKPLKEYIKDQAGEATTLLVEYSPTGADGSWHATFAQGDLYMRQSTDNGETWEGPMRIVGVNGERAHTLSVTSAGYGGSMQGLRGAVNVDGVNVMKLDSRGLVMVTIDRKTLAKVEQIRYDLYQYSSIVEQAREDFIAKVDELDDSVFVCLLFADNMTWTQPLIEAMKKLGSLGDIAMDGPSRTFAFIGYKGLTPGYALQAQGENQTLPPAEVSTYVADGMFGTNKTGADGQYRLYQWAIGTSTAVTGLWQDTPVTALLGQYVWMRSGTVIPPATVPAQWGTPIRLTGDRGADGQSTYLLDLTNETEGVACDASGNPTGTLPSTDIKVYKGATVDSGWTFTKADNGCQSILASADTLQITSLDASANTATVTVTATKAGCPTLTSIMNIYKVIPGQNGENGENGADGKDGAPGADGKPATVFRLLSSVDSVTRHADGSLSAAAVTCTVLKTTGDTTPTPSNEHTLWYQRMPDGTSGTLTRTNGVSGGVSVLASTEAIIFELRSGNTVLDRERVPVLSDLEDFGIGGENLLLNAGLNTKHYWESWALESAVIDAEDKFEGSNVLKIDVSGKDDWYGQGLWQTPTSNPHLKAEPDTYYSFGVWVYSPDVSTIDSQAWMGVQCRDASGSSLSDQFLRIVPSRSGVWEHMTGLVKAPVGSVSLSPRIYLNTNGKLWLSKPQLVRGAVLPDWAPSPYDFDYVTEALKNSGSFEGGLLLGSLIKLGYTDGNGIYHVMAGLNGLIEDDNSTGREIAFWAGGEMLDADSVTNGSATTAIRHDGTAYFSGNVIRMLKTHVEVGDNVRLDREGLKLINAGDTVVSIANKSIPTDFNSLSGNEWTINGGGTLDVPLGIMNGHIFTVRSAYSPTSTVTIGSLPAGAKGSAQILMSAFHFFSISAKYGRAIPLPSDVVVVTIRNGNTVLQTLEHLSTSSNVTYDADQTDPTVRSGSISYEMNETIAFDCPTAGTYYIDVMFHSSGVDSSVSAGNLMTAFVSVKGSVKSSLGENMVLIGNDGLSAIRGSTAFAINGDKQVMRAGSFGMMLDQTNGIRATVNGGQTWYTLKQSGNQLIFTSTN